MFSHKVVESWVMDMEGAWLDYPFGEGTAVYKVGEAPGKMFALIDENSKPLRLSLKCDPLLAEKLREQYETIVPGYHLNKKHWNTMLLTGQVPEDEIKAFIRHSYELAKA